MTIEEIYNSEYISVRSFNICNDNILNDLTAILNHYRKYSTFENLRNCGRKSNKELIALCSKYLDYDSNYLDEPINSEKQFFNLITNFTRNQREIVNSFIEINSNNLSNRSKNALSTFLDGNLKIRNINERIFYKDKFNTKAIQNVGKKSEIEINNFIFSIKNFIKEVSSTENESELIALKTRFFIEKIFSISTIPNEIIKSQSIFILINFLFNQNELKESSIIDYETSIIDRDPNELIQKLSLKRGTGDLIFNKNISLIFEKTFKIYNDQHHLSSDEIASDLNISRERIRQIRKSCVEELFEKFKFIKNIDDDLFQKYGIDTNQDLIKIDENLTNLINKINDTCFSTEFITYIIFVFISDDFELIGEIEDVLLPRYVKSRNRHNWNNFYLVNNRISSLFNFNEFANDIENRLNEKIEETYSFNFKSYINNFSKINDNFNVLLIFPIAEKIINQEFDLIIDLHDNIVFKRNTVKPVPEYAIEALEKLGVPSKLEEIFKLIEKRNPEITKSQEALRGSLQRTAEIIYFGRSSTYGLKKWEIEKEGIKGGTIKDIIFEYLNDKSDPIHIIELLNEVHKYREKTNAKSIITNLKLDPQKQFIIFNQSFIGLIGKTYKSNLTSLPKFLGKIITKYINKQKFTSRIKTEKYFSIQLKISETNMNYIITYLIEQQFLFIDNQNNLIT